MSEFVEYGGKTFEVEDGFLVNFDDWCKEWVEYSINKEGIGVFTDEHLRILLYIRAFYKKNGAVPTTNFIRKEFGLSNLKLFELFPRPSRGACQMAGVPVYQ